MTVFPSQRPEIRRFQLLDHDSTIFYENHLPSRRSRRSDRLPVQRIPQEFVRVRIFPGALKGRRPAIFATDPLQWHEDPAAVRAEIPDGAKSRDMVKDVVGQLTEPGHRMEDPGRAGMGKKILDGPENAFPDPQVLNDPTMAFVAFRRVLNPTVAQKVEMRRPEPQKERSATFRAAFQIIGYGYAAFGTAESVGVEDTEAAFQTAGPGDIVGQLPALPEALD